MIGLLGTGMAGGIVLVAAAALPTFNVEPSCRAAAVRAAEPAYVQVCLRKEQEARETIAQQWSQFTSADRAQCMPAGASGGRRTYTDVLTCLEMARDVRNLRKESPRSPPVRPGPSRRVNSRGASCSAAADPRRRCRTGSAGNSRRRPTPPPGTARAS
jgi:hypothetical protein